MKKHIVCFGDSNTHGYCADPKDCPDPALARFSEEQRWTCLLQKALGEDYLVLEEGLSGRTTVFDDPLHECMAGLDVIYSCLMTHEPVSLLIIMLGTNDTKERLGQNAACISLGMDRLVRKAKTVDCWGPGGKPNILIVAPPHILPVLNDAPEGVPMGKGCVEKSRELAHYYEATAKLLGVHFLDAEAAGCEFNQVDGMHLTSKGHATLAKTLAELVPTLE